MPALSTTPAPRAGPHRQWNAAAPFSVGLSELAMWRYLLVAVVVVYLLAPTRLPGIPVSAHGALLVLIFIAHVIVRRGRVDAALLIPSACFFGPMAIAAVVSPTGYAADYLRPLLLGGIASYLFAFYFRTYDSLRPFRIVLILLVVAAAYLVAIASAPLALARLPSSLPLGWGTLEDPILFGLFLIVGHLAVARLYLRTRAPLLLGPLLVTTLALIATASRGIWLGALCGTLVYLGLARSGRRGAVVLAVMVLAFWGFNALMQARLDAFIRAGGNLSHAPPTVTSAWDIRLKSTLSQKNTGDLSSAGRWGIMTTGLRMWRRYPLFGVGPGKFVERAPEFLPGGKAQTAIAAESSTLDPHNIYIAILTDAGAVGMLGFLGMLGLVMARAWHRRGEGGDRRAAVDVLLAGMIALSVVGLAHDVHLERLWWITLGLLHGQGSRG